MARPSKYNQALQKKFDELVDSIGDIAISNKQNKKIQIPKLIEEFFTYGDVNSIAVYLGLVRETIYDWKNENSDRYKKEFSDTFKRWNTKRKAILFRITPFIDKTLAIFYMKTISGYIEVQGVNVKSGEITKPKVQIYLPDNQRDVEKKELNNLRRIIAPKKN